MLTFWNRRMRTRMYGGVRGRGLAPPPVISSIDGKLLINSYSNYSPQNFQLTKKINGLPLQRWQTTCFIAAKAALFHSEGPCADRHKFALLVRNSAFRRDRTVRLMHDACRYGEDTVSGWHDKMHVQITRYR